MKQYVYALYDPSTQERRWIGITSDPVGRLSSHCYLAGAAQHYSYNTSLDDWVVGLRPEHPVLRVLCVLDDRHEALRVELELVKRLLENGEPIFNKVKGPWTLQQKTSHGDKIRAAYEKGAYVAIPHTGHSAAIKAAHARGAYKESNERKAGSSPKRRTWLDKVLGRER